MSVGHEGEVRAYSLFSQCVVLTCSNKRVGFIATNGFAFQRFQRPFMASGMLVAMVKSCGTCELFRELISQDPA